MEKFDNLPKEVIDLLEEFLLKLKLKTTGYVEARYLPIAIENISALPNVPEQNMVISFNYEDTWLYIIFTDYKIELSDSYNDGIESYTRFSFRYEISGYKEVIGDLNEFRWLLFNCLSNVTVKDIRFSQEE